MLSESDRSDLERLGMDCNPLILVVLLPLAVLVAFVLAKYGDE